ncbi:peptidylprolyl isomerase [Thiomicrorhabdus lithotrophica]|uniref:Chaperone SurA n=1 Tax=Thiomicrorhabdus lithotrophica TaxID=2949997 RepID=A0ABY8CB91_9GAMM|nr:peptidylprolyl isomerase [Thiomicrorhabdus lithotrophica]WEJ63248.1 peptidylprolyl isomerase [Thiomicrorhabdus lithotrophica]
MKKTLHSALFSLFTSLAIIGSSSSSVMAKDVLLDKVVAVVNDRVILKSELTAKMYEQAQALAAQNIPVNDAEALKAKVLDSLILEVLQEERANQIGLNVADDEVNAQMQQIAAQNNLSLLELRNRLNIEMPDGFQKAREKIKQQLLIQKLREAEVISQAQVTESEIQNYLKRQKLANKNVKVKLNHILIALPESATPQQREKALSDIKSIQKRIQTGEDFSQLAVRYSNGGKALSGGDLGWMQEEEIPTFFADALEGLKPGQVSEIIESASGFHLIKLADKQDSSAAGVFTEYHLHRFIILSDDVDRTRVPASLMTLSQSLNSMQDFQALFDKYSDIPAEVNADSDLGWRVLDKIPSVIREDVAKLKAKNALPPLATDKGWMILYLDDIREINAASENETQKAIQAIRVRKANEMFDLWLRRLKDEAFIQIK